MSPLSYKSTSMDYEIEANHAVKDSCPGSEKPDFPAILEWGVGLWLPRPVLLFGEVGIKTDL